MRSFFKVLKYIFLGISLLIIVSVAGLNIYYSVLLKSLEDQAYPDPDMISYPRVEDQMKNYQIRLIPYPKRVELLPGLFQIPEEISFQAPEDILDTIRGSVNRYFGMNSFKRTNALIHFSFNEEIENQGYHLTLQHGKVQIQYRDPAGAHYAIVTLRQLHQVYSGSIPNMIVEDAPDLPIRGVMLDISRDKIPTLETLYEIIDILADLKYNHLELYVEGFSFGYPSFEYLWKGKETPVTGDEIRALDEYCRERFIDLVPNQNSLGHMTAWLETAEFADMAECPKGYRIMPFITFKSTLDPYDPRSIQLVERMMDDLLPNFSSAYFNANLDEPFELGQCKSKKEAEKLGVGKVYLEFADKVRRISLDHNKRMMMWADVAVRHPEILQEIPRDIILLDWGYEAEYPFHRHGPGFQDAGLEYFVCPGTSSWTSIGGRSDNMIRNVLKAVQSGLKYNASGMVITDWGDMGHWQYLPISYTGFVVGGGLSWNTRSFNESLVENYLDMCIFKDQNSKMGSFALDLGRYNQFEEILAPNMTLINLGFQLGLVDRVLYQSILNAIPRRLEKLAPVDLVPILHERFKVRHPFNYKGLMGYLEQLENELDQSQMMRSHGSTLIMSEYKNAIALIRIGAGLKFYIEWEMEMSLSEKSEHLKSLQSALHNFLVEHRKLWLSRNRAGGLGRSIEAFLKLEDDLENEIHLLGKGNMSKNWQRLQERTIAAAAALIL